MALPHFITLAASRHRYSGECSQMPVGCSWWPLQPAFINAATHARTNSVFVSSLLGALSPHSNLVLINISAGGAVAVGVMHPVAVGSWGESP